MSAGVYDLEIEQGATKLIEVKYQDSAGQPVSLVGYQGRGQIRNHSRDAAPVAEFIVEITDPPAGVVRITLPATAIVGILFPGQTHREKFRAAYDVELFHADGTVIRLLNGSCYISPEVTK